MQFHFQFATIHVEITLCIQIENLGNQNHISFEAQLGDSLLIEQFIIQNFFEHICPSCMQACIWAYAYANLSSERKLEYGSNQG